MKKVTQFEKEYWDQNYSDPSSMDCIGNVKEHIKYIKYLFALEYIDINSIADLGCGTGHFFKAALKEFLPYKAYALEPSEYAFNKLKKINLRAVESMSLKLENISIGQWCQQKDKIKRFDLGICTSVFQYLSDQEIEEILPVLAQRFKYIYFTVPTNIELKRQVSELDFFDRYAIRRSRTKYQRMIRKYFTFISSRMLESKVHFSELDTSFTDLLFRF